MGCPKCLTKVADSKEARGVLPSPKSTDFNCPAVRPEVVL